MLTLFKFLNLCSVFVWVGGIVFFSFILTPTLFKTIPKETTSKVLDALFPKYYFLGYLCGAVALLTQLLGWFRGSGGVVVFTLRLAVLVGMVFFTYYAGLIVFPEAHRLKVEMQGTSAGEAPSEITKQFHKIHRLSVLLNVLVLLLGLAYIWILAKTG